MLYDQYNDKVEMLEGVCIQHVPGSKSGTSHTYSFSFDVPINFSEWSNGSYNKIFYLLYGASGNYDDWKHQEIKVTYYLSTQYAVNEYDYQAEDVIWGG